MANLNQSHFRFGKEELLEATHGWWQNEDTNHTQLITANWAFLLRFCAQNPIATALANVDTQFQYNKNSAGWVNITTSSAIVKAVASVAFTDAQTTTKRLSGTGSQDTSNAGCTEDGLSGGTANDIPASGFYETEAGLQVVFADVANGDTIQFRLTSPDATIIYIVTPTLTIQKVENRQAEVSWAEVEVPNAPRQAEVSWTEVEFPDSGVRAEVSWAEVEVPNAPRSAEVSWAEVETPEAPRAAEVSWSELEVPTAPRAAEISWGELEVPNAPPSYTTYSSPFLWTAANWGSVNIYLEVYIRAIVGTVYARLLDSNNSPVTNSEVSTASTTFQRLRSSALTLTNGLTYRVQFGKVGSNSGEFLGAKLLMIPA